MPLRRVRTTAMELHSPDHPGRAVRLAYCLNLHPGETPAELRRGLAEVTVPLRERLAPGREFGVGMYVPAAAAATLAHDANQRAELAAFLAEHGLDPFTWNAFPFGRFHDAGLKASVFEPTWSDPERLEFTTHIASLAAALAGEPRPGRHLSISTHTGMHSTHTLAAHPRRGDLDLAGQAQVTLAAGLAGLEQETGWRTVLYRITAVLLIIRFAVPVIAILNEGLYSYFLEPQYTASREQLELKSQEIGELNAQARGAVPPPENGSWLDAAKRGYQQAADALNIERRLEALKRVATELSEHAINLIVVFSLQTILFPLLFLWLALQLMKLVARARYT